MWSLLMSDCQGIMAIIVSICSFIWFKNIHMKYCRFINTIAASCFGVLLIHANSDTMRQWLWQDIANVQNLFRGGAIRSENYINSFGHLYSLHYRGLHSYSMYRETCI